MRRLTSTPLYRPRKRNRSNAMLLIYMAIGASVAFFLLLLVIFIWYSSDLPEPGKIQRRTGYSTTFYDRNGKVIYDMYKDENRIPVHIDSVSDNIKKATIAIEDKDFYSHSGFSTKGIIRAVFNAVFRRKVSGGSTLTQQLVKNTLLTQERTVTRKIKEFVLSTEIERRYSKDQILEMYLNESPYGGPFWGVESAAKGYFGKSAKDVSLVEAAILAGLPQRPSYYSPFIGSPSAYKGRTHDVLRRMREDGDITKDEEKNARSQLEQIQFTKPYAAFSAPHYIFYLTEEIQNKFGREIFDKGVKIKTSIDLDIQKKAEQIVHDEVEKIKSLHATNGAAVVLDTQTGEILAMVGSYDYNDKDYGQYNTALAMRQPGSSVKPITYATAFEKGYTPSTTIMDVKTTFPDQGGKDYTPENYDGKFRGPIQLRFALGNSINLPAVKLLAMVGIRDFLGKAYDMGLSSFNPNGANAKRFGLAITLGGGETTLLDLTSAYSTLARGGIRKDTTALLEIKDANDKTIYEAKKPSERRVLSDGAAFLISHILSDSNARAEAFGARSYLTIPGKTVAVKTGTTNDKRDNWTLGYTKAVTVGVWVGNNDNSPMNPKIASGITGASPIWHSIMSELLKKYDHGIQDKPAEVDALQIDSYFGGLPKDGYPTRSEYFIKGTEPKAVSPYYKKLKISRSTGKLANDVEIKTGDYDEKEYIVIAENDPVSTDGKNRWQEAIDEWQKGQSDSKFHPPTETSDANTDNIVVQIKEPGDKAKLDSTSVKVRAKITSLDPVAKIELSVNGTIVKTYSEDKHEIEEYVTLADGGVYTLRVYAENAKGRTGDSVVRVGINKDPNQ